MHWLTLAEAADYLGYSYEYFRRLVVAGAIRSARHGKRGSYRFQKQWLDEFLLPPERSKSATNYFEPVILTTRKAVGGECEYGLPG
jgi:excisionase family DNA binding protein